MAALFNMSPWRKMTTRPLAWVTPLGGLGVIPLKLQCALTQHVQTHTETHTLHEKQTKRLINYVYYRLSCCRSIKLCCSIWSAGSLIRALLLSAANCLCRSVHLHTCIHPEVSVVLVWIRNVGRVWRHQSSVWNKAQGRAEHQLRFHSRSHQVGSFCPRCN